MVGNRVGKTYCGATEGAMHLTGVYPAWWEGRRSLIRWKCGRRQKKAKRPATFSRANTSAIPRKGRSAPFTRASSSTRRPDAASRTRWTQPSTFVGENVWAALADEANRSLLSIGWRLETKVGSRHRLCKRLLFEVPARRLSVRFRPHTGHPGAKIVPD